MSDIFNEFSDASIYLTLAVVGTALFVIKLIMMMLGSGHGGPLEGGLDVHSGDVGVLPGTDAHAGHHMDSDVAFQIISIQSILAFFMGAGWAGLTARVTWHWSSTASALGVALPFGLAMMLLSSTLTFYMKKLNYEPVVDVKSTLGTTGRVYLTIPPKGQGIGQVEVNISGRRRVIEAISSGPQIQAFDSVKVVAVDDLKRLIVEKIE